ncbi:hypothetical protein [Arthrobacter cryoconiti]|uniref:Uncharacterized protein n=1 Tax=Arthrobacter cryoconiti TaxID=748907 RepID=A0ABV8R4X2_9MICC|nr:hypothetical protein [Arthrobacter cryoconiti]MCC9067876.1 hypothetical protein [Arthrobacter cryoconiti]
MVSQSGTPMDSAVTVLLAALVDDAVTWNAGTALAIGYGLAGTPQRGPLVATAGTNAGQISGSS